MHSSLRDAHRLHTGCSPPHLTFRLRQGSQENALFLVALTVVDMVGMDAVEHRKKRYSSEDERLLW